MGGYCALSFAERFSEKFASLTLLHSTTKSDSEEKKANRLRQIDIVKQKGSAVLVDAVIPGLFFSESDKALTEEFLQNGKLSTSDDGAINALHAMRERPDRTDVFANLSIPTQIIGGRHDALISPESLYDIASGSKYCNIEMLENSGHMGMVEEPVRCADLLLKFWQGDAQILG
jgi:pimeloyl-ACP methyl ester carboxylesterase